LGFLAIFTAGSEADVDLSRLRENRRFRVLVFRVNRRDPRIERRLGQARRSKDTSGESDTSGHFMQPRQARFFKHRPKFRWRTRQPDDVTLPGSTPETWRRPLIIFK